VSVKSFEPGYKIQYQDFKAVGFLGSGAFGKVFVIQLNNTEKYYALKVLKKKKVFENNMVSYAFTERNIMG